MSIRPLVVDDKTKSEIARVIDFATKNKYPIAVMMERMKGGLSPGDLDWYTCFIQVGYKCVYTVEEHPMGWAHHLSVSIDAPGKCPAVQAVQFLMKEFGIETEMDKCYVYMEGEAVNIIAKM